MADTPLTPLTEEMLNTLPPNYRAQVEQTRSMYGEEAGMEEYQDMLNLVTSFGAPQQQTTGTSRRERTRGTGTRINESDVIREQRKAIDTETINIYDRAAAMGEPITRAEARKLAVAKVAEQRQVAFTPEGRPISGVNLEDYQDAGAIETALLALQPQNISVGERGSAERAGIPEDQLRAVKQAFLEEPAKQAREEALEQAADLTDQERYEWIQDRKHTLIEEKLSALLQEQYIENMNNTIVQKGWNQRVEMKQDENGLLRPVDEQTGELLNLNVLEETFGQDFKDAHKESFDVAKYMKREFVDKLLPEVYDMPIYVGEFSVPGGSSWNPFARQISDRPAWYTIQEAHKEGSGRAAMYEWGRSLARQDDIMTGDVSETWFGAITRDTFGALSLRPVVYTALKKLTWDRNPETGLPYDQNDPIYRLDQALDSRVEEAMTIAHDVRNGRVSPEEANEALGKILEGGAAAYVGLGIGGMNVPEHLNTGSDWKDFWLSHARGEWLGTDISRMDNAHLMPHWYPTVAGLFVEVLTPVKQTALGIGVGAARDVTKLTSAKAAQIADGMQYEGVSDFFNNVNRWADREKSLVETVVSRQAVRDFVTNAEKRKVGRAEVRPVTTAEDAANRLGPDVAQRVAATPVGEDIFKSRWFKGWNQDDLVGRAANRVAAARDQFVAATKSKNWVGELKKTETGRDLLYLAQEIRKGMPRADLDAIGNEVLTQYATKEMYGILQDALPNNWVRISSGMIARKTAFNAVKDKWVSRVRDYTKTTTKKAPDGKVYYKFTDRRKATVAARVGAEGTQFQDYTNKLLNRVAKGDWLTEKEFIQVSELVSNAVAESLLGSIGSMAVKGQRISKTAYRGRALTDIMGGTGGAAATAINRELKAVTGLDDFMRGLRVTMTGKSDYIRAVAPSSKGLKLVGIKASDFGARIDPVLLDHWTQTTNLLNEVMPKINKVLQSSDDKPAAANRLLESVYEGDELKAYREIFNLFWAPKGKKIGDILSNSYNGEKQIDKILKEGISSGVIPAGAPTFDSIRSAISFVESKLVQKDLKRLSQSSIRQKHLGGLFGLSGKSDVAILGMSYVVAKKADQVFAKAMLELEELRPDVFLQLPDLGATAGTRASTFGRILKNNGINATLSKQLETMVRGTLKGYSPTDQRQVAKQILTYVYNTGFMASSRSFSKMFEALDSTMLGMMGARAETPALFERSFDAIRQEVYRFHGGVPTSAGRVGLPDDPVKAAQAKQQIDLIGTAWIQASTDLDISKVRGLMGQLGIQTNAPKALESGGQIQAGLDFGTIPGNKLAIYDAEFAGLVKKYENVDVFSKVNAQLENLRPQDRGAFTWLADGFDLTRKTTISGLLGGWAMPGLRFMGTNALTAPAIVGITTPQYMLTSLATVPASIAGGFMRAARRTGIFRTSDAYDYTTLELKGGMDDILFRSPNGRTWTRKTLEEAMERQNIRFSRSTFDFQFDALADAKRMARLGPDGRPVSDMTFIPGVSVPGTARAKKLWSFWRPDRKNFFSIIAEEMDNIHREAVFAQALKNGENELNAGLLARASMLDYGALPPFAKSHIARNFSFFAFRFRMTAEFFGALARGGEATRNIGRTGAIIQSQYEDMQDWVMTPDWAKTRYWREYGEDFKQFSALNVGIQVPWSEPLELLGWIGNAFLNDEMTRGDKAMDLLMTTMDQADPRLGPIVELYQSGHSMRPGMEFAPDGMVPSNFLSMAEMIPGGFELAASYFELEPMDPDRERPDLPLIRGRQWKFGNPGAKRKWLAFQLGMLATGLKRSSDDLPRALAKFGIRSDDIEFRRDAEGNPVMYMLGGTSAGVLTSPEHIRELRRKQLYYIYRDMAKAASQ